MPNLESQKMSFLNLYNFLTRLLTKFHIEVTKSQSLSDISTESSDNFESFSF